MCQPQQILHVIAKLDGYGPTRQLELLVKQQLAAGKQARVIALAAEKESVAILQQLGVDCRVLDRRWQRDPFVAVRLASTLRRLTADLLHVWDQTSLNYLSAIRRVPGFAGSAETTPMVCQAENRCSPAVATPAVATLSREKFLVEQRLPADSILIAVAGPLTRDEQIDEAIWYFELVRTLDERVRLLIFGNGPDRHRLERFARLTSEPQAIRFLGYRRDFRALLSQMNLFWQTSVADEVLPLTMLEAMAAGVPVIAHDSPACRRVITDNENGYLVAEKDRAAFARESLKLIQDLQLAEQIGKRATEVVAEQFSVNAMTQAVEQAYSTLD